MITPVDAVDVERNDRDRNADGYDVGKASVQCEESPAVNRAFPGLSFLLVVEIGGVNHRSRHSHGQ